VHKVRSQLAALFVLPESQMALIVTAGILLMQFSASQTSSTDTIRFTSMQVCMLQMLLGWCLRVMMTRAPAYHGTQLHLLHCAAPLYMHETCSECSTPHKHTHTSVYPQLFFEGYSSIADGVVFTQLASNALTLVLQTVSALLGAVQNSPPACHVVCCSTCQPLVVS